MKLQPDLQLFAIDDDVVVFSEQAQNLLVLNASAASLVRKMLGGASTSEAAGDLVHQGIAPEEAGQWAGSMMETLGSYGMLVDVQPSMPLSAAGERNERQQAMLAENLPPYSASKSVAEKWYRLLDTCTLIRFGDLEQVLRVDSVIGR